MPFQINCNNKGCGKMQQPVLDLKDNQVYCSECDNIINNVPIFTKNQMKSLGQTRKPQKSAYAVKCNKCKQETLPKIDNNNLICAYCNSPHTNISKPFEILIRKAIKDGNQDI